MDALLIERIARQGNMNNRPKLSSAHLGSHDDNKHQTNAHHYCSIKPKSVRGIVREVDKTNQSGKRRSKPKSEVASGELMNSDYQSN